MTGRWLRTGGRVQEEVCYGVVLQMVREIRARAVFGLRVPVAVRYVLYRVAGVIAVSSSSERESGASPVPSECRDERRDERFDIPSAEPFVLNPVSPPVALFCDSR